MALWRNKSGVIQLVYVKKGSNETIEVHPGRLIDYPTNPNRKAFELLEEYTKKKGRKIPLSIVNPNTQPEKQKDLVSVIIPTYNCEKYLKSMLASVWNQKYKNIEIIVVDDGSTDGTVDLLCSMDSKINKLLTYGKNRGSNYARNIGFRISRGSFLIFCDADMVMKSEMIGAMKSALDNDKVAAFAYCKFRWIREKNGATKIVGGGDWNLDRLKRQNYISTMSLLRREYFIPFDEKVKRYQDYDFWWSIVKNGKRGTFVNSILFDAWMRKDGISETESEKDALSYIRKKHGIASK